MQDGASYIQGCRDARAKETWEAELGHCIICSSFTHRGTKAHLGEMLKIRIYICREEIHIAKDLLFF